MIEVTVSETSVDVSGHAGYAEKGDDIVCASISVLTQTLISGMKSLTKDRISYEMKPGRTTIWYKDLSEQGQLLIDSFFIGVCGVSLAYGDEYVYLK